MNQFGEKEWKELTLEEKLEKLGLKQALAILRMYERGKRKKTEVLEETPVPMDWENIPLEEKLEILGLTQSLTILRMHEASKAKCAKSPV